MIISLRGTNGAGKSTIVRQIMSAYETRIPLHEGRRRPIGYVCASENLRQALFVPGHYEIANGGVDTLPDLDTAYALIRSFAFQGMSVLYEGKNMSDGPKRALELVRDKFDVRVAVINEPIAFCTEMVRQRGHNIKEETIKRLWHKCTREYEEFTTMGVITYSGPRARVLQKVRWWLQHV